MAGKRSERARKRLIIAAVATVLIVAGGGGFWGMRKVQLKSQRVALRAQGLEDARAGNNEKAAEELWSYLQVDPDDREVLEKFAVARLAAPKPRGAHVLEAIRAYRRLKLLQPGRQDVNVKLCELYLRVGGHTELLEFANQALKVNPNELVALRGKATALQALSRKAEANEAAEQWLKVAPDDVNAMLMVLQSLVGDGQSGERAVQRADEMVKARPDDPRAQLIRGIAMLTNKRVPEAYEVFRELIPKVVKDEDLAIRLASQLDLLGKTDDAANLLAATYDATKSTRIRLLLARRAMEGGRFEEAIKLAESPAPENRDEAAMITVVCASLNKKDTTPVTLSDPGWTAVANALLNRAAGTEAETRKAIEDIQSITAIGDIGPYPIFALGVYTATLGETERATDMMIRAAEAERGWSVPLKVASDLALRSGSIQKAKAFAEFAVQRQWTDLSAHLLWARAYYAEVQTDPTVNTDRLLTRVQDIQKAAPGEPTTLLICLDLLGRRNRVDEAKALISESVLKRDNVLEEAVLGAALTSQTYKLGMEQECLALAEKRFGKTPRWRYMTAIAIAQSGKPEAGLAIIQEGVASASPEDKIRLAEMAAQYAESSRLPNAASLWKAAIDANPNSPALVRVATTADSVSKDPELLNSLIERLKSIEGAKGSGWRLAQAKNLLRANTERSNSDAAVLLGEIIAGGTPTAEVHMLLAQTMQKLGNYSSAIAQLNAAVRLDPNNARTRLLLAALLQMSRDTEGAKKQIEAAVASDSSPAIRLAAAEIVASQGDVERAIKLVEAVPTRNREQLAMLGELYERSGKREKAAAVAKDLLADSSDARAILLKARVARSEGKKEDAEKTLTELERLDLPPLQRKMLLAKYYTQVGDLPRALTLTNEVIAESPKTVEAYRLKVILQLNTRNTSAAIATAESSIAAGLNDPALKSLAKQRDNVEALMSRGLMPLVLELVTRPEDPKVIRTTKAVADPDPINVANSVNSISAAATETSGEYALQQSLIRTLGYLGRINEASPLAANLARSLPFSQEAALLWVEVEMARGNDDGLLEALAWLDTRSTPAPDNLALLYCRLLRKGGQPDQIERANKMASINIQPGAPSSVNRTAWLVEYGLNAYARGKRADFDKQYEAWAATEKGLPEAWGIAASREIAPVDTLRWLERLQKSIGPTVDLAFAAEAAARRSSNEDLNRWADTAIAELYAKSATLPATNRIDIAVFQEGRGDYKSAEATYRSLIDDPKYGLPARNNLAVVLSRRGAHDEAVALAESVVKVIPTSHDFLDTLGTVQEKAGKNKEALASMEKVMRMAPGTVIFRIHYAHALYTNGKIAEAKAQLAEIKTQVTNRPLLPLVKVELDDLEKLLTAVAQ